LNAAGGFDRHYESSGFVQAPIEDVFAYADDPARLAGHMAESAWMMGGGRMDVRLDDGRGQRAGSRIVMAGRAFGLDVYLEEVIAERAPPRRKTWHTLGVPKLIVMGAYRMGYELAPTAGGTRLRVFIDYDLPERGRWLGRLFGRAYARWCTRRIVADTSRHFPGVTRA
jgi:hypothetical protein